METQRRRLFSKLNQENTAVGISIARQRPQNKQVTAVSRQRNVNNNKGITFSERSTPMAAHTTMDTATEERCFLCG
jgi:hypothetical protein